MRDQLERLGLHLPSSPAPAALYSPARREGTLIWVAGQLPFIDGQLAETGRVGAELDLAKGVELARIAALNCLAVLRDARADLEQIRVLNLVVYVASGPDFRDQHKVADGVSSLFQDLLGDRGHHARTTVAVPFLPLDSPLEIQSVFAGPSL